MRVGGLLILSPFWQPQSSRFDPSAGTRVDEGIQAVEERIAQVQHIADREVHVDIAVGVCRLDVAEVDVLLGPCQLKRHMLALGEGLRRQRGSRRGSKCIPSRS